ncbi:MAG: hypothetical protein PUE01_06295 [Clostridiaceae bacterium]|nr:hypothetical protein [Clostridiaceae bacterium]
MSKSKMSFTKIFLFLLLIGGCIFLYINHFKSTSGLRVKEWDNIYNEDNITFFYTRDDAVEKSKNLKALENKYSIKKQVDSEKNEIDKVLKVSQLLNNIVQYDDVEDSSAKNGNAIIKEKGSNMKVSGRDLAYIQRDFLIDAGFIARIGEFRKESPEDEEKPSYFVVEYWSTEHNKWVMFDAIDKGYFEKNNIPLSAIELFENDLNDIVYIGNESQNDHRKKLRKFMNSYTVPIDSTIGMTNSNCNITYCKDSKDIDLKKKKSYIEPTIFTNNKQIFKQDPDFKSEKKDQDAYLILMYKNKEDNQSINFVAGAFKDGAIIEKCYMNINGQGFKEVDNYTDIELQDGENTIELSLDGVTTTKKIVLENNK